MLAASAVAAFAVLVAASIRYSADAPLLLLAPLGLLVGALGFWVVAMAYAGSPAAIMAYFSVLVFVNDAQFRVRGAGETEADWQSVLKFGLWLGAGAIGSGHLPPIEKLLGSVGSSLWLAYIGVALVSSIYSPIPGYSLGCAVALLCFFMFANALVARLSEGQILWTFVLTMTFYNVVSWLLFFLHPELGTSPSLTLDGVFLRMCGLAGQATNLGYLCAQYIGAVFLLWWGRRCPLLPALALMGFGTATLIASDCRTMIIAVAVGVMGVIASRSLWMMASGILALLTGLAAFQFFPSIVNSFGSNLSRSGEAAELYTMTGRTEIWDFVGHQIAEKPILGWGYNSSKAVLGQHMGFEHGLMVDSAHNLFLQSMLSVGILGSLPLIALLFLLGSRLFLKPAPIVAYFVLVVLVGSVSDTGAVGTTPTVLTLVFLMISIWPSVGFGRRLQ